MVIYVWKRWYVDKYLVDRGARLVGYIRDGGVCPTDWASGSSSFLLHPRPRCVCAYSGEPKTCSSIFKQRENPAVYGGEDVTGKFGLRHGGLY
jgi:hypothetical protein